VLLETEELSQILVWQRLDSAITCANAQAFPTDGANCKDTIFNDPRMTLGSCVKDPNNTICREWVWKGMLVNTGQRFGPGFTRANTKAGLDSMTEPYIDMVWEIWLLGISPRSITLSPSSPFSFMFSFPFILVFPSRSSSTCQFFLVWGNYSSCQSIRQNSCEKLDSMVWVWACQVLGSTLWCWQLSPAYCSCTKFVLFFMHFMRCWAWDCPQPHPWAFKELSSCVLGSRAPRPGLWTLNTKWAGMQNFRPHNSPSKSCFPTF